MKTNDDNQTTMQTLESIGREAHEINAANGWEVFRPEDWQPFDNPNVPKLCTHMALVHTEVAEATEAVRHRDAENFREELADTIIRVASIAYGMGLDLESAINLKLAKNRERGLHHGGKSV